MTLEQKLEGVLFYKAAPIKKAALAKLVGAKEEECDTALLALKERLESGATRLLLTDSEVELVAAPELDELIDSLRKDEMKRDIGKAGAETLAIILYKGPIARADIDRIRGVNSSFILRNLLVRDLIEKDTTSKNILYKISPALLAHLGISEKSQLADFTTIMNTLETYEREMMEETTT